jgi:hypothetical protein
MQDNDLGGNIGGEMWASAMIFGGWCNADRGICYTGRGEYILQMGL